MMISDGKTRNHKKPVFYILVGVLLLVVAIFMVRTTPFSAIRPQPTVIPASLSAVAPADILPLPTSSVNRGPYELYQAEFGGTHGFDVMVVSAGQKIEGNLEEVNGKIIKFWIEDRSGTVVYRPELISSRYAFSVSTEKAGGYRLLFSGTDPSSHSAIRLVWGVRW